MEKQGTQGITSRKLGLKIGDYVFYNGDYYSLQLRPGFVYRITYIDDSNFDNWPYKLSNTKFWVREKVLKKATKQEYIVAKLKGKLYEQI